MLGKSLPEIVLVTRPTDLQSLRERFVTDRQVKFFLKQANVQEIAKRKAAHQPDAAPAEMALDADDFAAADMAFAAIEERDQVYTENIDRLRRDLDFDLPVRVLDRAYLANFDFGRTEVVIVVGQDGLVANTAKYVGNVPIIAVNPDPDHIDGVLLPFQIPDVERVVERVLEKKHKRRQITLAEARLNDGQRMLAFNDFFIGIGSHASARYRLEVEGQSESQSSSGILVATGAGSTGWLSSVINMARGVGAWRGNGQVDDMKMRWEDRRLAWVVREPFVSKMSGAELVAGELTEGRELVIESQMPTNGVIFSDGIEQDFLQFNSGTIVRITVSGQRANLVIG